MSEVLKEIYNKELLNNIRKQTAQIIAEELISVQPVDPALIKSLYEESQSKEWLEENGYEPVSSLGLLYTKKR